MLLCDAVGFVTGLEGFMELMVEHVMMKLRSDCSFQNLSEERKVGDQHVVVKVIEVQTRLFEERGDRGNLETGGHPDIVAHIRKM